MNPHTAQQERQPGGRFGAKLPPPAPLTAVQQLARMDELRNANGGWLVPPPDNIDTGDAPAVVDWLTAIVDAGGTPADLQRAWHYWRPPVYPGAHPRLTARDAYDALNARAAAQTVELRRRAAIEDRPQRAIAAAKYELKLAEQALADAEPRYLQLKAALATAQARLASVLPKDGEA